MMTSGRNLIVLSDGTGNSAAKSAKTNVWRLYQALDLTDGRQVAVFGDGVGTSSVKVLRILGLALGVGVKRNVLNLYKFLCRNYTKDDRIWAFGFSRGAYTIRVLVGLIDHQGLVTFDTEAELERNAIAAYRAFRKEAFATRIPWVRTGRFLRDQLISFWNKITGAKLYEQVRTETRDAGREHVPVHFIGVWDTVAAYGLPIDELTQAVDKWVWPMSFRDRSLLERVGHARQALSLDDERRTFFPIPWDEGAEAKLREKNRSVAADRLLQVWFAGAHADVGGGYPDDGLSYVPLCWMIEEAKKQGLAFEPAVEGEYFALATPTGRIYDPRAGFGAFWRYQPRDVQALMGKDITPIVHGSVMTRMICGNDRYAPISLPQTIGVLPPDGPPIKFEKTEVEQAQRNVNTALALPGANRSKLQEQLDVLTHTMALVNATPAATVRTNLFKLVLDTVWWRRVIYFVSLFLVTFAALFPLLAEYLQVRGVADLNDRAGGSVGWAVGLVKGFLPGIAEPWTAAIVRNPAMAVLVIVALLASLRFSSRLQGRICDRARAAWNCDAARAARNVGRRAAATPVDRLQLTGQRHALAVATLVLAALAIAALKLSDSRWLWIVAAAGTGVFALLWTWRMLWPPGRIDPAKPGVLLSFARAARTNLRAVAAYRYVAQTVLPALFLLVSGLAVLALGHRATFDLLSAGGEFCKATDDSRDQARRTVEAQAASTGTKDGVDEKLEPPATFVTDSRCHKTGLRLVAGRKYRIRLDMERGPDGEWFDQGRRVDVAGFAADDWHHYSATPLKRWWRENWFQPIARIGEVGNYEHVLRPAEPLPVVNFSKKCPPELAPSVWDAITNTSTPAPTPMKLAQLQCDPGEPRPNRTLISDITANATGELFLYVNDAVLTLPGLTDVFYKNNSGKAKVTVTRIMAEEIVPPPTAAGVQARLRDDSAKPGDRPGDD
jgi:uncharacterized protein (DUF2235 family)